jgi:DNA-binding MarR family transcriptional regulator
MRLMVSHDRKASEHVDPVENSQWRPLRLLLSSMDDEIARLYAESGLAKVRPRYSGPLIELGRRGPATIRALADAFDVTHSGMSQTIKAMREAGLVESAPGDDARTRHVRLTPAARKLVPFLEAEWAATEAAIAELEAEIPYPVSQVVRDIEQALGRRSFFDRIRAQLGEAQPL